MVIGVLKEIKDNEYRVAAIPAVVSEIRHHGHSVLVQSGAGVGSGFSDEEYASHREGGVGRRRRDHSERR